MSTDEIRAKMYDLTRRQSLPVLAESLARLAAMPHLDSAERYARHVLIDVICEKSPAADAAFDAWSEGEDNGDAALVIISAVRGT